MTPHFNLSGLRLSRLLTLISVLPFLATMLVGCDAKQANGLEPNSNSAVSINDQVTPAMGGDASMADVAPFPEVTDSNASADDPLLQETQKDTPQDPGPSDSQSLLGKASSLFNKAKEKGAESARNATGWVQEKYNGTAGATSDAADSAINWANDTFESLKAKGLTTANSTSEWLSSDWKNMESWEYKVISNPPTDSTELESQLNQLGAQGWECIDIRDNRLVFKKQRESYLRRLPFKDLLRLAPLMNMGKENR